MSSWQLSLFNKLTNEEYTGFFLFQKYIIIYHQDPMTNKNVDIKFSAHDPFLE
jgi:hypothetical protein